MIGESKKYELIPDHKMKDQTNYPTMVSNTLELKPTIPSYEELEAKVWQLEHELDKSRSEAYTLEADFRLLKSEYEDLKLQMIKDSYYTELGKLYYKWVKQGDPFNMNGLDREIELYKLIQESEAGNV